MNLLNVMTELVKLAEAKLGISLVITGREVKYQRPIKYSLTD